MSETHQLSEAELLAELSKLELLAEAETFLTGIATALFPDGILTLERLTWSDPRASMVSATQDPQLDTETRLREAEARFRTLVEQIPAVTFMAVLGEGKNEVYVSPHIEQMLGYSQKEWLEDPFLWYWRLHPDDRPLWNEEFSRGCRTGGPFRAECRFIARDDRTVWVHGEARVVRDELGRPLFLQGVAFDITEAKRAQQMLLDDAVSRAKIDEELAIAKQVQTSILPRELIVEGYEIAAVMIPADDVGGDYYDVQVTPDAAFLGIGDVSGHGLDAGLVMLMVQSAMAAIIRTRPYGSPRDMLESLNEVLYDNIRKRLQQKDHVTLTLFRLDHDGRIVFSGAHEDILLRRATSTEIERVRTPGVWLGAKRGIRNVMLDTTLRLEEGDIMVLFTDGVTEGRDASGAMFDITGIEKALAEVADRSVFEIRDHILARSRAHLVKQDDDMSLVVLRRNRRG